VRVLRDFEREGVRCSCFPLLFLSSTTRAACSQVKCDKFFKYMSDEHPAFAAENGTRSKTLVTVAESMHTERVRSKQRTNSTSCQSVHRKSKLSGTGDLCPHLDMHENAGCACTLAALILSLTWFLTTPNTLLQARSAGLCGEVLR
jgi:hypothetical protein